jgi:RNA polymerase sigma-70 factor (ECF subfamily)
MIVGYSRSISSNSTISEEEVISQSILRVWQSAGDVTEIDTLPGWITTICRNVFLDLLRKKERTLSYNTPSNGGDPTLDFITNEERVSHLPEESFLSNLKIEIVHKTLSHIPSSYRQVIELHDIKGYSYWECAVYLSVPIGTIRSRLHRARGELKKEFLKLDSSSKEILEIPVVLKGEEMISE